jgi:undecaprenyl pyrophosphate phosphatase UppP
MKIEQTLTILYAILGVFTGVISNALHDALLGIVFSAVVYLISVLLLVKFVKSKRMKFFVYESIVTFLLVWILVWAFLYTSGKS